MKHLYKHYIALVCTYNIEGLFIYMPCKHILVACTHEYLFTVEISSTVALERVQFMLYTLATACSLVLGQRHGRSVCRL